MNMLKSVEISNFKAFNKTQRAKLKPITLIYGENSAGKSSFIQSILLMKQSINEHLSNDTTLVPKGEFLDLGNYKEMVYGHDDTKSIKICHEFKLDNNSEFEIFGKNIKYIKYESIFKYKKFMKIILDEVSIYYNEDKKPFIKFVKVKDEENKLGSGNFTIEYIDKDYFLVDIIANNTIEFLIEALKNKIKEIEEEQGVNIECDINIDITDNNMLIEDLKNITVNIDNFIIFIENLNDKFDIINNIYYDAEIEDYTININNESYEIDKKLLNDMLNSAYRATKIKFMMQFKDLILKTTKEYRKVLNSINYLGPLREYPERNYIFSGISPTNVGKEGKYTNDLLFTNRELIDKVNQWLHKFNINYDMHIDELKNETMEGIYFMRLVDKINNVNVSPLDVGFGISQILPIIVQSVISKDSIICIEQPEIHIHPKLQAELGTFFSECIKNNNQFIIETHSEHLMLRIQKLIREDILSNDDVSVIYIDRGKNGSKCIELRLDEDGDFIDEWPNGFFEEGYREMF